MPSSAQVFSSHTPPEWHKIPIRVQSKDPTQLIGASIAYSVTPAWYVYIRGEASRPGQATIELNNRKVQVTIFPGQSAGTTANLISDAFKALGHKVEVSGVEKPTPEKVIAIKARIAEMEHLKKTAVLSPVKLYRLEKHIEILKSALGEKGFFTLTVHAPTK